MARPTESLAAFSGDRLQDLRREAGFSRTALAAKIGLSYGAVESWEQGAFEPSLRSLISLMKVLNCSFEDLCLVNADDPAVQAGPSKNAAGGLRHAARS